MEVDGKGLTGLASEVFAQAGIAGLVLLIAALGGAAYFVLRAKGGSIGPPKPHGNELTGIKDELGTLNRRFGDFDKRLSEVERDLDDRPTREEIHQIDKSIVRLEERFNSIEKVTSATNAGVNRLEEFMINASGKGAK